MDDLGDDSTNVVVPLRVVHEAVLGSALAVGDVGFEDTPTTLTARSDDATHLRRRMVRKSVLPAAPFCLRKLLTPIIPTRTNAAKGWEAECAE